MRSAEELISSQHPFQVSTFDSIWQEIHTCKISHGTQQIYLTLWLNRLYTAFARPSTSRIVLEVRMSPLVSANIWYEPDALAQMSFEEFSWP